MLLLELCPKKKNEFFKTPPIVNYGHSSRFFEKLNSVLVKLKKID